MSATTRHFEKGTENASGHPNVKVTKDSMDSMPQLAVIDWTSDQTDFDNPMIRETIKDHARRAEQVEVQMSLTQSIKIFWRAILHACVLSFSCIMEGYDTVIVFAWFATPKFKKHFGCIGENPCEVPVAWQFGLVTAMFVGEGIGLIICGILTDKIGFKQTMFIGLILMAAAIFIPLFAENYGALTVGLFFCGVPWGIFQTLPINYASDINPTSLRGYVTSYVGLCWIMGQLIGAGVQYACLVRYPEETSDLQYKIPIALQWIWVAPLLCFLYFIPESPTWLVRNGKYKEAHAALAKLSSPNISSAYSIDMAMAQIYHNDQEEKRKVEGTGYLACMKGVAGRRTCIASVTWGIQQACGAVLLSFSSYFLTRAGLPKEMAFRMAIIQYSISFIATCASWKLSHLFQRRTVYMWGLSGILFCEVMIGTFGILQRTKLLPEQASAWCIAGFLILMSAFFGVSINPVTFTIVAELPSPALKAKTVNIARGGYILVSIGMNAITPFLLNTSNGGGLGALSAWIFFGIASTGLLYAFFKIPECKGLTYANIDELFERGTKARNFRAAGQALIEENNAAIKEADKKLAPKSEASSLKKDYLPLQLPILERQSLEIQILEQAVNPSSEAGLPNKRDDHSPRV